MTDKKLNIMEPVAPTPTVTVQPVVVQQAVVQSDAFVSKMPSDWHIEPIEDTELISARSNRTQEYFEGTIEEFNRRIRG